MRAFIIAIIIAVSSSGIALADSETIRPTGAFDTNSIWQNEPNTYDNNSTSFADITTVRDGRLYVGATGDVATDAWDAPSAPYTAGTLYCTYSSDGWSGNDVFSVEIRNGAANILAILESATSSAVAKTTKMYTLAGGYLSDQTDLRCVGRLNRSGSPDTGNSYIYEAWIVGNFDAPPPEQGPRIFGGSSTGSFK